jgi:hypothetical protein
MDPSRIAAVPSLADLPAVERDELAAVDEVEVEAGAQVVTYDDADISSTSSSRGRPMS